MEVKDILFIAMVGVLGLIIGTILGMKLTFDCLDSTEKKKRKSKYPKCDCTDVNQCSKWCYVKEKFNRDFQDGKV